MKQQADLITHLCQFSQNVLVIIAPQWGGKTAFVDYYLALSTPGLRKYAVKSTARSQVDELMQDIAQGFGLPWEEEKGLDLPEESSRVTWVLLVDDAHLLSLLALQALLKLVNLENAPHRQLHVILFGEPTLESRLSSSDFGNLHEKMSIIELEVPDEEQGEEEKMERRKERSPKKKWTRPVTMGLLLGALVAGSYLFLNGSLTNDEEIIPVNTAQKIEEVWEDVMLSPQKTPLLTVETETVAPEVPSEASVEIQSAQEVQQIEEIKEVKEVKKAQAVKEKPKALKKTAEEKHLLSVDRHAYTLQLVGARKESGVKHFIQRHAIEDKAYYFKTKLGGKEWYVVVYGEYPSLEAAKQAAVSMPSAMKQESDPWIRKMEAIHQDIKETP